MPLSNFPPTLDDIVDNHVNSDEMEDAHPDHHNQLAAATNNLQNLVLDSYFLNATWYGADPTGVNPSATSINATLAAASALGARGAFCPAGEYKLESPIAPLTDTWLKGAGWQATTFKIAGSNTNNNANGIGVKGWLDHVIIEQVWVKNCEREAFYMCPSDGYAVSRPGSTIANISSVSTGASPTITTSAPHGLTTGLYNYVTGSNSTPAVDGTHQVTVLTPTTYTITPGSPVTIAGTAAGTSTMGYPTDNAFDGIVRLVEVEDSDIGIRYTSQYVDSWWGPRINIAADTADLYVTSQGSPALFYQCWFNGNPTNNIYYPASGTDIWFVQCVIENSKEHNVLITEPSFLGADHTAEVLFVGCRIKNGNSSAGAFDAIHVAGYAGGGYHMVGVTVDGCTFESDVHTPRYAIYATYVKRLRIGTNNYQTMGTGNIFTDTGCLDVTMPQEDYRLVSTSTTPYTMALSEGTVIVDATAGAKVVNLPTAASSPNRVLTFKKIDASGNTVTITRAGSDTIDGATTLVLSTQYQHVRIVSTGSTWWVI